MSSIKRKLRTQGSSTFRKHLRKPSEQVAPFSQEARCPLHTQSNVHGLRYPLNSLSLSLLTDSKHILYIAHVTKRRPTFEANLYNPSNSQKQKSRGRNGQKVSATPPSDCGPYFSARQQFIGPLLSSLGRVCRNSLTVRLAGCVHKVRRLTTSKQAWTIHRLTVLDFTSNYSFHMKSRRTTKGTNEHL